jgi:uncharacterized Tic20 family protein
MNELLKNPILLVIPYLYVVSICYYWGYWGMFNIDIFNYYGVQDIIKGATNSMFFTLVLVLLMMSLVTSFHYLIQESIRNNVMKFLDKHATKFLLFNISIIIIGIYSFYKVATSPQGISRDEPELTVITLFIIIIPFALSYIVYEIVFKNIAFKDKFIKSSIVIFCLSLPVNSFAGGIASSLSVLNDSKFDYIINSKKKSTIRGVYKYLGKAGDYYFLSTLNNKQYITVKADSIQPLIINHYSAEDLKSVEYFIKTRKYLLNKVYMENKK